MADRELQTVLNSGEITTMYVGGITTDDRILTKGEIETAIETSAEETVASIGKTTTGFDLRNPKTKGVIELCGSAASGVYWRIDENDVFSTHTGATTFGDGTTALVDRMLVQYPASGESEFSFYLEGVKYSKNTTQSLQYANVSTIQIATYSKDTQELHIPSSIYEAIEEDVLVAVATGNPTITQKVVFGSERHGMEMSSATHRMMHGSFGARYGSGLELSGLANNGSTFTSVATGVIWDEDIEHTINAATAIPFIYRDTQGYWAMERDNNDDVISNNNLAFTYNNAGGNSYYNRDNGDGSWSVVDASGDYVINHIWATNDSEYHLMKTVGQAVYGDRNTARQHMDGEMALFKEGSLPTPEFLHLYSYILDGNGNIETGADGEIYIDYKQTYPIGRY